MPVQGVTAVDRVVAVLHTAKAGASRSRAQPLRPSPLTAAATCPIARRFLQETSAAYHHLTDEAEAQKSWHGAELSSCGPATCNSSSASTPCSVSSSTASIQASPSCRTWPPMITIAHVAGFDARSPSGIFSPCNCVESEMDPCPSSECRNPYQQRSALPLCSDFAGSYPRVTGRSLSNLRAGIRRGTIRIAWLLP
jgi:hypothetical protein